jgi:transglutaminase superfamily protein
MMIGPNLAMLRRKALTAEAMILLAGFVLAVRWCSVRRLLARHRGPLRAAADQGSRVRVLAIRGAIRSATARLPFHVSCLAQSLAATAMLRRADLPYRLKIGAAIPQGKPFGAHAWVESLGITVAGEGENSDFSILLQLPTADDIQVD